MTVFGTRPEVIKLAPVIFETKKRGIENIVCSTGQHRQMLDQMVGLFDISVDVELDVMTPGQTLEQITSRVIERISLEYDKVKPDVVIVQGDTTTAFVAALAAFYKQIPVAHVEAGLRTDNRYDPFPEEINRRLISQIANYSFAPTDLARKNLLRDGVVEDTVTVTGNTVVDALQWVMARDLEFKNDQLKKLNVGSGKNILVTTHRRENVGQGMASIFTAVARLAEEFSDYNFIFPVHMNPKIQELSESMLGKLKNVTLTAPLEYTDLALVMKHSKIILTDSGGIQEEAPALGVPVLVLRKTTERPEGVDAGVAKLVGTDADRIYLEAKVLLTDNDAYTKMAQATNPYGDGRAAAKIIDVLSEYVKRS